MKKKMDPDPLGGPCIGCQSYVRSASSFTSRERNHPKKAFFCDDVGILDCTIFICNVLDMLDLKNKQKEANIVIFKICLKVRSFTFFIVCIFICSHSLSSSLVMLCLMFVVSIVCLTRVCYNIIERKRERVKEVKREKERERETKRETFAKTYI